MLISNSLTVIIKYNRLLCDHLLIANVFPVINISLPLTSHSWISFHLGDNLDLIVNS